MEIKIYQPAEFKRVKLDIEKLNKLVSKEFSYVSKGRWGIYHILKSYDYTGKIMVPVYICSSVLIPLKQLNLEIVYYDIDSEDLNPCIESIEKVFNDTGAGAVLIPSLYGNPANLVKIEKFCNENKILMIDDGAQSFGAILNNRYVGTFGNGGLFSFSPGKSTAGHLGGFFWTDKKGYDFKKTSKPLVHYLYYLDFYYNRLNIYDYSHRKIFKLLNKIVRRLERIFDLSNDSMSDFENEILGGIIHELFNNGFKFRLDLQKRFISEFSDDEILRPLKSLRGEPHNHKLVCFINNEENSSKFRKFLNEKNIYFINGYPLLKKDAMEFPGAESVDGRVFELPMENNDMRMDYLFSSLREFISH